MLFFYVCRMYVRVREKRIVRVRENFFQLFDTNGADCKNSQKERNIPKTTYFLVSNVFNTKNVFISLTGSIYERFRNFKYPIVQIKYQN